MKTTTKKSFVAITCLFMLAAVSPVAGSEFNLHTGVQDQGYTWGQGTYALAEENQVSVTVTKNSDYIDFKLESGLIDGGGSPTVTFDTDNNGVADYQIQRQSNGEFMIAYSEGNSFGSFKSLPSKFGADYKSGEATVSIPISELDNGDRTFKFGAMILSDKGQVNYPNAERLWWNGDNYKSSDHYMELELDHFDPDTTIPDTDTTRSDSSIINTVMNYFTRTTDNAVKNWVSQNFVSREKYNALTETVMIQQQRIQALEDEIGVDTSVDRVSVTQQVMLRNDVESMTVESDGKVWSCNRRVNRFGEERIVCSTGQ